MIYLQSCSDNHMYDPVVSDFVLCLSSSFNDCIDLVKYSDMLALNWFYLVLQQRDLHIGNIFFSSSLSSILSSLCGKVFFTLKIRWISYQSVAILPQMSLVTTVITYCSRISSRVPVITGFLGLKPVFLLASMLKEFRLRSISPSPL